MACPSQDVLLSPVTVLAFDSHSPTRDAPVLKPNGLILSLEASETQMG